MFQPFWATRDPVLKQNKDNCNRILNQTHKALLLLLCAQEYTKKFTKANFQATEIVIERHVGDTLVLMTFFPHENMEKYLQFRLKIAIAACPAIISVSTYYIL